MVKYPKQLELDTIFVRVNRGGKFYNLSFTDLTEDEQRAFLGDLNERALERMCLVLAKALRTIGEEANSLEHTSTENTFPFGYNADGTLNEREAEVVRFVFSKQNEYFFNPPQELIDEAYAWAKEEGMTLNDEEAADMARARIPAYIARQVQEKFPDVKYRKAAPVKGRYPTGLKYPSRPLKGEEIIDRDLFAQVREIMAHG